MKKKISIFQEHDEAQKTNYLTKKIHLVTRNECEHFIRIFHMSSDDPSCISEYSTYIEIKRHNAYTVSNVHQVYYRSFTDALFSFVVNNVS